LLSREWDGYIAPMKGRSKDARTPARRVWTPEDVRALGLTTDLVTACSVVFGCGKDSAWAMYRAGTLGFPTMQCGLKVVVPVAPLLRRLHLVEDDPAV
jgi:hypothetical protein